jgi:hypothetical protein
MLDIHLVDDADIRRHRAEVLKCVLPPLQKHVALSIAFEFTIGIEPECFRSSELIHLHRVINHQIHLLQGINLLRISTHSLDDIAHGRQIDDSRNAGEILHQHARRPEGNFLFRGAGFHRLCNGAHIVRGYSGSVFESQQVSPTSLSARRAGRPAIRHPLFPPVPVNRIRSCRCPQQE